MSSRLPHACGLVVLATTVVTAASASPRTAASTPRPDVVVTSLTGLPATATPREALPLTFVVTNAGKRTARASFAAVYLSRDRARGKGDPRLTPASSVGRLKPRKSARRSASLLVPAGTDVGPWFVVVCADDTGRVREAKERNNCRPSATPVVVTKVLEPPPPPTPLFAEG